MSDEGASRTDMTETEGTGQLYEAEAADMDVQTAVAIMREAGERARRELWVRRPVVFATWGLAMVLGYGAMWLSVRRQQPYRGPAEGTYFVLFILYALAVIITGALVDRAAGGVGGRSVFQRGVFVLALFAGYAALGNEKLALSHDGVGRPVLGVLGAAVPLLTAGLVFVASSAVSAGTVPARPDWTRLVLGVWLLAVGAGGTWAGPVTDLAIYALVGGGGVLLMAVVQPLVRRS